MSPQRPKPTSTRPPITHVASTRRAHALVGAADSLKRLVQWIDKIALTDQSTLIVGPPGSGKNLAARCIHERSPKHAEPFIELSCGALPASFVDAELFGHVLGAFPGAFEERRGLLELVGKGTLLLDEVGDLPLAVQAKLVRVIDTRTFNSLGSFKDISFEGRIVATTRKNLFDAMRDGQFRADLFYRLSALTLNVPSLTQRLDDLPLLLAHFSFQQMRAISFTSAAVKKLSEQPWPENIRQLRDLVIQLSALAEHEHIDVDTLEPFLTAPP
ncbi:sigma-54-dependent transcriptional regulator [Paraburkholderia aspalathi]|uniref:sigma-54-dependent transcriptional regulator n=1 Tax=Paraburkholderia aspalathi TaxID=1324617 RepID=UPI003CBE937C